MEAALAELSRDQAEVLTESYVNGIGYDLLRRHRIDAAVAVFRWNVAAYPEAWNVHDSLGEALAESGDVGAAIVSYERSLELHPDNDNARTMLARLRRE
jgi:D-alanyl-D-alanine carboxypeptidase